MLTETQKSGRPQTQVVQVGEVAIGGPDFVVMAGPCSVENKDQVATIANSVQKSGAHILRGGLFKMRTDPSSFQGLGKEAFDIINELKRKINIPFISEVTDARQISDMHDVVDVFQVGSRNMHNYSLLSELGKTKKPILLKRSFSGLIEEWLKSAEYISKEGNPNIILCERGIRTFETATRNTFDLNAVAFIKQRSHLPIIADPSHGTGQRELVTPLALAAAVAGADGSIVEVHNEPAVALSDGFQALTLNDFSQLMARLSKVLTAVDRRLAPTSGIEPSQVNRQLEAQ